MIKLKNILSTGLPLKWLSIKSFINDYSLWTMPIHSSERSERKKRSSVKKRERKMWTCKWDDLGFYWKTSIGSVVLTVELEHASLGGDSLMGLWQKQVDQIVIKRQVIQINFDLVSLHHHQHMQKQLKRHIKTPTTKWLVSGIFRWGARAEVLDVSLSTTSLCEKLAWEYFFWNVSCCVAAKPRASRRKMLPRSWQTVQFSSELTFYPFPYHNQHLPSHLCMKKNTYACNYCNHRQKIIANQFPCRET